MFKKAVFSGTQTQKTEQVQSNLTRRFSMFSKAKFSGRQVLLVGLVLGLLVVSSLADVLPDTSIAGPSLTLSESAGRFYMAWTGTDPDQHLNVVSSPTGAPLPLGDKVILDDTSIAAPALAVGAKLYIAWTGTDAEHHLNIMSSPDAIPLAFGDKVVLDDTSIAAPALDTAALVGLPLPGRLYLAWTGTDPEHSLNVMSSVDGLTFENKVVLGETSNTAPALSDFRGKLYIAWTGSDGRLNLMSSADGTAFGDKAALNETSSAAPAIAVINNRLYIAWTGTDGRLNLMSSLDGVSFADKLTLDDTSIAAPALSRFTNLIGGGYIAWTGTDPEQHLNIKFINP